MWPIIVKERNDCNVFSSVLRLPSSVLSLSFLLAVFLSLQTPPFHQSRSYFYSTQHQNQHLVAKQEGNFWCFIVIVVLGRASQK